MIYRLIYKHTPANYWLLAILLLFVNIFYYSNNHDNTKFYFQFFHFFNFQFNILTNISFSINLFAVLLSSYALLKISKTYHEHFSITFPSFIFVFFSNTIPLSEVNTKVLVFFPTIIFLIYNIFKAYEEKYIYKLLFNFGFILGLLSFINIYYILILPSLYIWLVYFRQFNFREYFIPIIGVLIPYLIADAIIYILTNDEYLSIFSKNILSFETDNTFKPYFSIFLLLILFLFSLYKIINSTNYLKKIKNKKYHNWMLLSTIYLWIVFFLSFNQIIFFAIILFMSFTTSITIVSFKKSIYSKFLFISLFLINLVSLLIHM